MNNELFETVDYNLNAEIECEQFQISTFEPDLTYNVDGQPGQFVRYETVDGRQKYVFNVNGVERRIDHDFIYLVK